jgi:hypothetical protein
VTQTAAPRAALLQRTLPSQTVFNVAGQHLKLFVTATLTLFGSPSDPYFVCLTGPLLYLFSFIFQLILSNRFEVCGSNIQVKQQTIWPYLWSIAL